MFNDRYSLTQMVIEHLITITRRIEGDEQFQLAATSAEDFTYEEDTGCIVMCCQGIEIFRHKCRYKVGEVVAVGQSYRTLLNEVGNPTNYCCMEHWEQGGVLRAEYGSMIDDPGFGNKLFSRVEMMLHQICIARIRCERLQDITDEDCMKEGIFEEPFPFGEGYCFDPILPRCHKTNFNTPREAFAALIDKVSGRGTWKSNPWVVVYEFELVK